MWSGRADGPPRVAFYAPLKPPSHPVPSGDREMARNLMAVIARGGADVTLVSDLRLYDGQGLPQRQDMLARAARAEVARLIPRLRGAQLWVTYHNYYKAPDLVGPAVCRALGLPYVQIESTRSHKRLTGPWAGFAAAAEAACDSARLIFHFTANDLITLARHRPPGQTLACLPPFLPETDLPPPSRLDGPMLAAGMMRPGDKLRSYQILAAALAHLTGDWRLEIAGDGPARPQVEDLMAPFGDRVRFLGQLDRAALARAYGRASLFVWPGVNEAFGMVYLEAQAAGVPVVAQDRPGVRDVLAPGVYPFPEEGPAALAGQIRAHLGNADLTRRRAAAARAHIAANHLAPAASARFWADAAPILESLR